MICLRYFWNSLRENCPYLELFWPAFSRVRTEYGEIQSISPYSVRMLENTDQNNSEYGYFLRSAYHQFKLFLGNFPTSQQKEPSDGVLRKRNSKNMQQLYRRTLILRHECSPVYLLHIFRTIFPDGPLEGCLFIRTSVLLGNIQNPNKHQRYSFFQKQLAT